MSSPPVLRVAAACILAPGLPALARFWIRRCTRDSIRRQADDLSPREVAIVPGCVPRADGTPSAMLADRLAAALELYRRQRVGRIFISGNASHPRGDEASAMRRWLLERDVPERDLLVDGSSHRTRDTMQRAVQVYDLHSATVCTQRFHLPRSLYLALRAGLDAQGLVADRRPYKSPLLLSLRELAAQTTTLVEEWGRS